MNNYTMNSEMPQYMTPYTNPTMSGMRANSIGAPYRNRSMNTSMTNSKNMKNSSNMYSWKFPPPGPVPTNLPKWNMKRKNTNTTMKLPVFTSPFTSPFSNAQAKQPENIFNNGANFNRKVTNNKKNTAKNGKRRYNLRSYKTQKKRH